LGKYKQQSMTVAIILSSLEIILLFVK